MRGVVSSSIFRRTNFSSSKVLGSFTDLHRRVESRGVARRLGVRMGSTAGQEPEWVSVHESIALSSALG